MHRSSSISYKESKSYRSDVYVISKSWAWHDERAHINSDITAELGEEQQLEKETPANK
jgi:hypothetical protein